MLPVPPPFVELAASELPLPAFDELDDEEPFVDAAFSLPTSELDPVEPAFADEPPDDDDVPLAPLAELPSVDVVLVVEPPLELAPDVPPPPAEPPEPLPLPTEPPAPPLAVPPDDELEPPVLELELPLVDWVSLPAPVAAELRAVARAGVAGAVARPTTNAPAKSATLATKTSATRNGRAARGFSGDGMALKYPRFGRRGACWEHPSPIAGSLEPAAQFDAVRASRAVES